MRLRTAINEYKRDRGGRFPGESRTVAGALSGHGDRLVHVNRGGRLRDYSAALSGLYGLDRSRFGIETTEETLWLDDLDAVRQHYYNETSLVETEYDAGAFTVHQYDLTLGRAHVTHVELRGEVPADAHLVAFLTFAPEGQESRVGRLVHERAGPGDTSAVEVYHRREHDYVTASTGLSDVRGQIPERFPELLGDEHVEFPREAALHSYEDAHLSGDIVVTAPLERVGRASRTTLVSRLADHGETDREAALDRLRDCAEAHPSADSIRAAARERTEIEVPEGTPRAHLLRTDRRVLDLLEAPTGARIAAPEFDPFYANSGGYGYTWFREDAASARHLLSAAETLGLDEDQTLAASARFYCETQREDGTWPHRVWASDGSLAPGWANAKVEGAAESREYQADQTATVTAYLATLLRTRADALPDGLADAVRETVADALDALDATRADDGLPVACQNRWEDMEGRFTHTAATYLHAYAAVARLDDEALASRALGGADAVFEGLDHLYDPDRGVWALRLEEGVQDVRLDASTFALVDAFAAYDAVADLPTAALDRLVEHVDASLDGLYRDPAGDVAGVIRYEEDRWRRAEQDDPKVWTVATGLATLGAARLGALLNDRGRQGDRFLDRATELYELLGEDGPFATAAGYLAEQVFDDGSHDSGTPIGRGHALRMAATGALAERDALPTAAAPPAGPGERPRWTTGEKYGVGTVADHGDPDPSRVWFTLTEGALTEARFPRIDLMNLRTLDFLVDAAEDEYTVRTHNETRRDDETDTVEREVRPVADDALLYEQVVTETGDGQGHEWRLRVEYATDPDHEAIVADVNFEASDGADYDVYAVADVALTNTGTRDRGVRLGRAGSYHLAARDETAYTGETSAPLLVDDEGEGYSVAFAMAAQSRFDWATVGVAGSETLGDLFGDGAQPTSQDAVEDENVVLVGRLGQGSRTSETLALGFGRNADTAAALGEALGALSKGYDAVRADYRASWDSFLADKPLPDAVADDEALANQYRAALMTLLAVEDKTYLGGSIASPSVPWGEAVAAEEPRGYGYNFVWARDLYQVFSVFAAVGDDARAVDQVGYIYEYQQDADGFIPQNTYVNGITRWGGEQMDNISFPQVMAYQLFERGYGFDDVDYEYANVRRSADYVARNGPETAQERWEEEAGYSPSSIAAEIAGLACAGKLGAETGHDADALVWLALADDWADRVAEWTATTTGTERHETTPYFVRATRDGDPDAGHLRTLANAGPTLDEREVIDAGFLELVRLGITPWDDEVVRNSVAEVDATIRVGLDEGPAFYRYNGDGYGERDRGDKGAPWSAENFGKGRLWPLLTGERAEYELHAGDEDPAALLETIRSFANSGRMLPEQVWDREHGTKYNWEFGEGTGSATPLAWSMAQFVRLAHGVDADEPVETPDFVRERYAEAAHHEADGPSLRVDTRFEGDHVVVSGETTAAVVAVKTGSETAVVHPEADEFEVELPFEREANWLAVAAADDDSLADAATTVTRRTF